MDNIKLSDLQLDILKVLWARQQATTSEVHQALASSRDLAYTTVATLLKRLEEKGAIGHQQDGRQYVFFPKVEESEVRSSMVIKLLERLFRGDPAALVNHLLGDERLAESDLRQFEDLISNRSDKDGK
jgi:BlaI family penicillinase repressor